MQRLVTIALNGAEDFHGAVQEHLTDYLDDGWRIASVQAVNGPAGGWLAVVLAHGEPAAQFGHSAELGAAPGEGGFVVREFPQSEAGVPVEPSDIPVTLDTHLEVGSTVLAYSQGRWWRAEVVALEPDEMVRLHFPGWDSKWDETRPRDELQVDLGGVEE